MLTLIKKSEYKVMPWKNGLGVTSEIAIYPEQAQFPNDPFLWRLSSAQIQNRNSFSQFEGYDRLLSVVNGEGLLLNNKLLKPLSPIHFHGEDKIECDLVSENVMDLGLIYKREIIHAEMQLMDLTNFNNNNENSKLYFDSGLHFLYCVEGCFMTNGLNIETGDTLKILGPQTLKVITFSTQSDLTVLNPSSDPIVLNSDLNSESTSVKCLHIVIRNK